MSTLKKVFNVLRLLMLTRYYYVFNDTYYAAAIDLFGVVHGIFKQLLKLLRNLNCQL